MLKEYLIRDITFKDVDSVVNLYNSNKIFLENHLGLPKVSDEFIHNEIEEMKNIGFSSIFIIDKETEEILGLCDYKLGESVYLSLLMLDGKLKGQGLGRAIYRYLENKFKNQKAKNVRIDVVDDYEENVVGFWEKQGFHFQERVSLQWGEKKSMACVMKKEI